MTVITNSAAPAEAERPNWNGPNSKVRVPTGNGGDPHKPAISDFQIVDATPKGLLKQVDELKTDLNIARKREKEAMALCAAISKVRQERMLKEGEKEMVSKAIKGMEEREDRMVSELLALEMGMGQPGLPFGEVEEKKDKPGPEAWRKVCIDELFEAGDKKLLDKLRDGFVKGKNDAANIITLGDITDFIVNNRLTDIKGIGEKAAEKIENAMEKWWAAHSEMLEKKSEMKSTEGQTVSTKGDATAVKAVTTDTTGKPVTTDAAIADTLASSGAPARAYDAVGVGTISAGGEPLKDQSPDGGQLVPVKEAMGESGRKKVKNRKTRTRATAKA